MPGIRNAFLSALLLMSLCPLFAGCVAASSDSANSGVGYDADSWKTLIAEDCRTYFDGCNTCRRAEGSMVAACTRKACAEYEKPRCLDDPVTGGSAGKTPPEGHLAKFTCDGGNRFRVYYDEYVSGDQRMRLAEYEIMLVDEQTRTAHRLERVRAASGAKYAGDKLEFWEHGSEAMLRDNAQPLYRNCSKAG